MNTTARVMRSTTFAAICGLTLAAGMAGAPAVLEFAPAAHAQAQSSTIDFNATGSITVHKRAGLPAATHDTGNLNDNPGGTALAGAEFTVWTVNTPFSNNADVQAAQKLTVKEGAALKGDQVGAATTGADGQAAFPNLPVGVYYVEETKVPEGYVPGAPFLVYVPMTNPANTAEWNYNVHVYPKNSETKAEKEVVDADKNVGDRIEYTITSDLPKPAEGGTISKYQVVDNLDARVTVTPADITVAFNDGTAIDPSNYTVTVEGTVAKVVFNEAGLKLLTANVDKRLVTTIKATVKEIGGDDGVIANTATIISNNGSGSGDTTVNTNEVKTKHGKLKVLKKDPNEANKPLAGAEFELYRCADENTLEGGALTVNGQSKWATGTDGTLTVDGLHVTDIENHDEQIAKKYCLKETKAPEGYELLAKPIAFTMNSNELDAQTVTLTKEIDNVKSVVPNLPLTGGAGIGLIVGLGALLIGAGAWFAKRNTNRA